ncbi:hypothetical protein [Psychromicrobium xiongbiense]|uniref:hypothetical protein n=1 Tax=Psychromicrobium xiongbiense TaxID=3051184 RepID=UPI0025528F68|nr:hypothetical protein [Psychromicrobium sp. YIM S02556]
MSENQNQPGQPEPPNQPGQQQPPYPPQQPWQQGQPQQFPSPGEWSQPPPQQPYPGQYPPQPGMPQPGVPQYGMPPYGPPQVRKSGGGANLGLGSAVGAGILFVAAILQFNLIGKTHSFFLLNMPMILPIAVGIGLLFNKKTRMFGTGMLIVLFSAWIVFVGPCTTLFSSVTSI